MAGLTLDSGAVLAFERGERSLMAHLKAAEQRDLDITIPVVVVAETWRGGTRSARVAQLLKVCRIEPLTEPIARKAGEALAAIGGSGTIDAVVMASAAARGDTVLTSDAEDLRRLAARFPGVSVTPL